MDRRARRTWPIDAITVAVCLVVDVAIVLGQSGDDDLAAWRFAIALPAAIAGPVALWWRRVAPVTVLVVVLVTGAAMAVVVPPIGHGPTLIVAVYSLAATRPQRESLRWTAVALGAVTVHQVVTWWVDGFSFAGNLVLIGGAWWLGDVARRRQEEASEHAARAEQLAAAREELARRAVADERMRIARELHDVVAHSMSAIAVQASTGRLAFDREPEVSRGALVEIESLSRETLAEMRRLLAVLRPGDGAVGDRAPLASLGDLDRLLSSSRAAGVVVDLRVTGSARRLPAGVDVAAFRIVQESLTNVGRHSAADHATVSIAYAADAVEVRVDDGGPPRPHDGLRAGLGIVGMRERAASCGGTLTAEAMPGGGFRVVAHLPTATVPAAT